MSAVKRLATVFARPIYRAFFEKPLWWFLARVKAYLFAEVGTQLGDIGDFLAKTGVQMATIERRLTEVEERLRIAETTNAAQWDAIEQLLLALFRQPEAQTVESAIPSASMHTWNTAEPDRVHAASNIR